MATHLVITGVCSAERRRFARLSTALTRRDQRITEIPADADGVAVHAALDRTPSLCVVDARHALDDLRDPTPLRRSAPTGDPRGDVGARARQAATLVELASAVVIVNWEKLPTAELSILMAVVCHLAPTARVRLSRGVREDLAALAPETRMPSVATPIGDRPGWTRMLNDEHDPFLTDRRVVTTRYEQLRPFHPSRLMAALDRLDAGDCGILLRSVGVCRIATRAGRPARWEQAGSAMWIDALGADDGWDDVGQDVALTGIDLNPRAVHAVLDAAVVTDDEFAAGPDLWRTFADPLPEWPVTAEPSA